MTLVQEAKGFRMYVNPGTENDGYVAPEWRVDMTARLWRGQGEWSYVGHRGTGSEDPERVFAFRVGRESVEQQRAFVEGTKKA